MKDLPYFKFYTGEWMKGDIMDCSMAAQGLFINICGLYWSRGCDLDLTRVQRKFNTCSTELKELLNDEIITDLDGKVVIKFLDEQFEQFIELSKKKSRAGKASAKMRKVNTRSTDVKQVVNKEEERRGDEKKEDNIKEKVSKNEGISLLKNSGVTIQMVAAAFKETTDLINADPKYYFDTAMDWSANGHMKKDWIATIRNFARRDIKDGKLKLSTHKQQGGTNISKDKLPDDYGTIRPGTMTLEEYKKLKKQQA